MISHCELVPSRFAAGRRNTGGTFRYTVSEKAAVRFRILVRAGDRYVPVASFIQRVAAGRNARTYRGVIDGGRLGPGAYRAEIVATDSAGNASQPVKVTFTILRRDRVG